MKYDNNILKLLPTSVQELCDATISLWTKNPFEVVQQRIDEVLKAKLAEAWFDQ